MSAKSRKIGNCLPEGEQATPDSEYPGLDILYFEIREQLVRQLDGVNTLNTKVSIIAGFDGLIISGFIGSLDKYTVLKTLALRVWLPWVFPTILTLLIGSFLASFILALVAYQNRSYCGMLSPEGAYLNLLMRPPQSTKLELIKRWICDHKENAGYLKQKSLLTSWSVTSLIIGIVLVSLTLSVYIFTV